MYSTLTYIGSFCIYVFQRVNNLNILVIIRSYSLQTVICTCMSEKKPDPTATYIPQLILSSASM